MLIVNADDWGGFPGATDNIERCFAAGAITSTTAMMFMADTERARDIAKANGRAIGLHLNLTQELETAPPAVRERQASARAHFADLPRRWWRYDPRPATRALLKACVADQLEEYRAQYGHEPTHVDSHHHVHVAPDVLAVLPAGIKLRQTLSANPGERSRPRAVKHAAIARRFKTTADFYGLPQIHPRFGGRGLSTVLDRARGDAIEVMCHPSFDEELPLLLSDDWRAAVAQRPSGSYLDL